MNKIGYFNVFVYYMSTALVTIVTLSFFIIEAVSAGKLNNKNTGTKINNTSFSFVVWGHPRGRADGDPPTLFEEILDRIAELKPDALFVTGDIIWGGATSKKDWERFDKGVKQLGIPVYRTPGNHDVHNYETRDIFLERYRKPPYAVTIKGSRFILLDTVDVGNKSQDKGRHWNVQGLPLDSTQIEFIRTEMAKQYNFNHVFFFMHHTEPWADQSGYWWEDVHPLLKGGRTHAVFSGDPYHGKYGYVKQDGITYIQSSIFQSQPINWFKENRDRWSGWTLLNGWSLLKQPDNIQYVRVEGDNVRIETIVVGALSAEGSSIRYWDKVEASYQWTQTLPELFYKRFKRLRDLVIVGIIWGGICFVAGMLVTTLWLRRRKKA